MAHEKVTDDLHEMSKPLARYKDDEDLENMLKAREREDDPMLQYIKSKKAKKNMTVDSHGRKRPKKGVHYLKFIICNNYICPRHELRTVVVHNRF